MDILFSQKLSSLSAYY